MVVERPEAASGVGHVVENLGDDGPPARNLALLVGAVCGGAIDCLLPTESGTEAGADGIAGQSAAEASADDGISIGGRGFGVEQRANGVEEDGARIVGGMRFIVVSQVCWRACWPRAGGRL